MINTIKKEKTTKGLALVAKLMGLAVIFNLASCGCGGKNAETKVLLTANDITDGTTEATVTLKNEGKGTIKLDTLKLSYTELKKYGEANYKTEISTNNTDELFEIKDASKSADIVGKTVKDLTKQEDLEPGKSVDIKVELVPGTKIKSATMKLVVKDDKEEKASQEFKWTVTP